VKKQYFSIFFTVFTAIALLWLIELLGQYTGQKEWLSSAFGVSPRDGSRCWGIFTFHLIHGNFTHLGSNTLSLFPLGIGFLYFYPRTASFTFLGILAITGLGVWFVGDNGSNHIGASGIVYGLAAYLVGGGLMRKDKSSLALALLVIVYYQGMFWSLLTDTPGVSWEGHFFGAFSGFLFAFLNRKVVEEPFDSIQIPKFVPSPDAPKSFFLPRDSFEMTFEERERAKEMGENLE
jgi:membrane associated rhomboid family serine protease